MSFIFPFGGGMTMFARLITFASVHAQPSQIFDDAIQRLKLQLKDSQIHTNKTYPGQTHINMNDQDVFRFNTFRAILILSWFEGKSASFSQST